MSTPITVRLELRVLHAPNDTDITDFTRTIDVPEVPRVGDTIYLDALEATPRKVIAREWGFDGSPAIRLATIIVKNDITPGEGAGAVAALKRDGWEATTISE